MARFKLSEKTTGRYLGTVESPTLNAAIRAWLSAHPAGELRADDIAAELLLSELDTACHAVLEAIEDPKCRTADLSDCAERTKLACAIVGAIRQAVEARRRIPEGDLSAEHDAVRFIVMRADAFTKAWTQNRDSITGLLAA